MRKIDQIPGNETLDTMAHAQDTMASGSLNDSRQRAIDDSRGPAGLPDDNGRCVRHSEWGRLRERTAYGECDGSVLECAYDLTRECWKIVGRTRGDQILVPRDFLIDIIGACVDEIVLDGAETRYRAAAHDVRGGQHPASVANCGHDLSL